MLFVFLDPTEHKRSRPAGSTQFLFPLSVYDLKLRFLRVARHAVPGSLNGGRQFFDVVYFFDIIIDDQNGIFFPN